ncbi:MAG: YkgJ family cysteine cluster protein [Desulfotignum sp.]
MTQDMKPVLKDEPMSFSCGPGNVCFNDCCRDLNQVLTPYDVLRLKAGLNLTSQEFLKTYTVCRIGPESGLPAVAFKPNPATGHACPLVTDAGCSVYPDRPGSCRLYPLARAVVRDRETGEIQAYYALIEEDHCKGLGLNTGQTVGQWLAGQGVDRHNRFNDYLMELISLKNRLLPGRLPGAQADQFYLALYDLDEFRHRIFGQNLLTGLTVTRPIMDKISTCDETLLVLGMKWVRYQLFGINGDE